MCSAKVPGVTVSGLPFLPPGSSETLWYIKIGTLGRGLSGIVDWWYRALLGTDDALQLSRLLGVKERTTGA